MTEKNFNITQEVLDDCKSVVTYCEHYGDKKTKAYVKQYINHENMPIAIKMAWTQAVNDLFALYMKKGTKFHSKIVLEPITGKFEEWLGAWKNTAFPAPRESYPSEPSTSEPSSEPSPSEPSIDC